MADNTGILRAENSKPDRDLQDSKDEDSIDGILPTRREAIGTLWRAGVIGSFLFVSYHTLCELITKPSIDDFANPTDIMIDRLSKTTQANVKNVKVHYGSFGRYESRKSFQVYVIVEEPSIIENYRIIYYFSELLFPGKKDAIRRECMEVRVPSSEDRYNQRMWCFQRTGKLELKGDNHFEYHDYRGRYGEHEKFRVGYGNSAAVNIRDLLGIGKHIDDSIRKNRQPPSSYLGQQSLKHV